MKDKDKIQDYVNNFRRRLAPHLKPGIGLRCDIHPAEEGGAVIEFSLGAGFKNDDRYEDVRKTVNAALSEIPQQAFGGDLGAFRFSGTNVLMEEGRIILIKDDSPTVWNDEAAKEDVSRILPHPSGDQK